MWAHPDSPRTIFSRYGSPSETRIERAKTKAHSVPIYRTPRLDPGFADSVYQVVCRTSLDQPGALLIDLGSDCSSVKLRQFVLSLKAQLSKVHTKQRPDQFLGFETVGRYDQQHSTRPHIDNGPTESVLILAYEASDVVSHIEISDYSMCAKDLGLSPAAFLVKYKPTTRPCSELNPYTQSVSSFSSKSNHVLVINNSQATGFDAGQSQGVLHNAHIPNPNANSSRVINSTMIAAYQPTEAEPVSAEVQRWFATTSDVL